MMQRLTIYCNPKIDYFILDFDNKDEIPICNSEGIELFKIFNNENYKKFKNTKIYVQINIDAFAKHISETLSHEFNVCVGPYNQPLNINIPHKHGEIKKISFAEHSEFILKEMLNIINRDEYLFFESFSNSKYYLSTYSFNMTASFGSEFHSSLMKNDFLQNFAKENDLQLANFLQTYQQLANIINYSINQVFEKHHKEWFKKQKALKKKEKLLELREMFLQQNPELTEAQVLKQAKLQIEKEEKEKKELKKDLNKMKHLQDVFAPITFCIEELEIIKTKLSDYTFEPKYISQTKRDVKKLKYLVEKLNKNLGTNKF